MKRRLTTKEYIYIASMLFGMFFGAGNLIFPVFMGQMAGAHVWRASLGFLITGVGLPLLGVALRHVFHLPAVSDHRAAFRHSALRHHVVHRGA